MKFPIDVAFLSADLTVVRVARLQAVAGRRRAGGPPAAPCRPRPGSLERWGVRVGDQLEVREVPTVPRTAGRERGAAGPAGPGGHADREPGRPLARGPARCWRRPTSSAARTPAAPGRCSRPAASRPGPHGDRLLSLHGHNEASRLDRVAAAVAGGATVAVVSDAGTPGISDPGAVAGARAWPPPGETVSTVPGPSSVARRAGGERAADRPLLRRGVPAPQGSRAPAPARPRSWPRAHHGRARGPGPGRRHAGRAGRRATRRGRSPSCGS